MCFPKLPWEQRNSQSEVSISAHHSDHFLRDFKEQSGNFTWAFDVPEFKDRIKAGSVHHSIVTCSSRQELCKMVTQILTC